MDMYFPTFFPTAVRSYDGRTQGIGVPLELPVMGTGREREIPLDLSIKTVRQSADSTADPDEVGLLLEHRKLLGLAGFGGRALPGSLLDPAALFRLPYRTDAAGAAAGACSGLSVPSIASPFCHPMMAGILQQRERCLDPHSVRTAAPQPVSPYMDPATAAALSLHIRSTAANAANQRDPNGARGLFGVPGLPGYSLFPEYFQHAAPPTLQPPPSSDPGRRPEEKGAFTTLRPTPTQATPTSNAGAVNPNDKTTAAAFLSNPAAMLDAARYAEHIQRIHEQHLAAKCSSACCVPTSASAVISGLAHHQPNCGCGACCVMSAASPHCPRFIPGLSGANTSNNKESSSPATRTPTTTPNSSSTKNTSTAGGNKNENTRQGTELTMPIYVPTTTAWSTGLPNAPNSQQHAHQGHVVYSNGTNTTTSHGTSSGKSYQSSQSRKRDHHKKEHSSSSEKSSRYDHSSPSRPPSSSKDSGSARLADLASRANGNHHGHHVHSQYHSLNHHSSSKHNSQKNNHHHHRNNSNNNNKEENEIIVIDDEPKSSLHRPQPTFPGMVPSGRNGLKIPTINGLDRLHIPHRPVPEIHRPRSPPKRSRSPYPEVAQPIPAKMPRLEAASVARPNPLPEPESRRSPTGPPPLIASVVPNIPVLPPSVYVPVYHGHFPPSHVIHDVPANADESARLKKLHAAAMLPPSQHPIPFVNGSRVPNGIPSDSPCIPSPCPAIVEPTNPEVMPAATEPFSATPAAVTERVKTNSINRENETNSSHSSPETNITPIVSTGNSSSSQNIVAATIPLPLSKDVPPTLPPLIIPTVPTASPTKKSYLASVRMSSPSVNKKDSELNAEDAAAADKRQRVLDLYSDLSEIDQQDLDGQKVVRLREFDKSSVTKTETSPVIEENQLDLRNTRDETSPTKPSSNTGPYGASTVRTDVPQPPGSTSPSPGSPKNGIKGRASVVEEELRQEALRVADARAKKKLRRRLLERLYHERMGIPCPDESETDSLPPNEEDLKDLEDLELSDDPKEEFDDEKIKSSANEDVKSEMADKNGNTVEVQSENDRRAVSQLNLTWRQRRLMQISCSHAVRRKRFRSGLDMIARRHTKKKASTKGQSNSEKKEEKQRKMCHMDEAFAKVVCEATGDLVMPPEMKRLMVNKALGETILHRAARQCYPDVVLYCVETKCCDVNARDNAGYTPLHECCSRGHLEIARALLQYGADVNASAAGGIRPLHDAVENDHVEIVRLLLSFGADPTISTYSGLSPLKLARSPVMAEFLRGFMADITGDADGRSVLPWQFMGSTSSLDPEEMGFDVFDGVPSDSGGDGELQIGGDDFLFEVSDSPHLPTFRLQLPSTKASCNCLRLSDILKQTSLSKDEFRRRFPHIEVVSMPRHEFEASATCSQLLTGTKLDALLHSTGDDPAGFVDVVKLDNQIRIVLGIETIMLR